ncbi:MAG: polynucleotide adenylyltransferase PcnB [Candidatus Anaerobiospirillum merdipullorum]|uniref:Poly(A) polymerase I n=1 Tax=Candidatus Anaerobiospirillum merdipullorum TaxID=2838450 RepID=A0A9E2KMG0_9GAMM|nr:polynucleotide adenylyltransferase PcnB [Candidatus Anaerobiospirillum merdipullorum]
MALLTLERSQHSISRKNIPAVALRTLYRLRDAGFKAYLVGGCVRDLLLGKAPKDFDISTNARPEQVHRIFKNSRIIGRRFKIVHVVYGNEIIEVTTFRTDSADAIENSNGMIVRDNSYGTSIEDDAQRRDFTINAIYYDIDNFTLLDFHGGLYDLTHGIIDIIGDPDKRYTEDPVRMIRAIRFKAKLGFKIAKRTEEPIRRLAPLLLNISNARMFDEVNKLFLTGHGLQSYRELKRYNILPLLFPGQDDFIGTPKYDSFMEYALTSSDQRTLLQKRNKPHFLYTVFLWSKIEMLVNDLTLHFQSSPQKPEQSRLVEEACQQALDAQQTVTAIPQVIISDIKRLIHIVYQITDDNLQASEIENVAQKGLFRAAFDLIKLRAQFEPEIIPYVKFWQHYYDEAQERMVKLKALQEEKRLKREEKRLSRREKSKQRKERKSSRRTLNLSQAQKAELISAAQEQFDSDTAKERQERLARARAWRAAMNLEP